MLAVLTQVYNLAATHWDWVIRFAFVPSRAVRISDTAHFATSVEKEQKMSKFRELHACIARLQALLAGDDVEPEQQKDIKRAMEQMKRLSRTAHPSQRQVFAAVREIADALLRAFLRN